MKVRSARHGEEDVLAETAHRAFRAMDLDAWVRYFRENTHRDPEDTVVADDGGEVVGHATSLRLAMRLGDRDVPFGGIAAVAVVPERRRQGIADRLLREALRRIRRRGDTLALLYPFSAPFYQKLGFGTCERIERVRVAPRLLPRSDLRQHVRRLDLVRDAASVRAVYERGRAGAVGPLARSDYWWTTRVLGRLVDGAVYVEPGSSRVAGYLLYDIPAEPQHPRQHCRVKEYVAVTPDAHRGLLGFLEALGEQFDVIDLELPPGRAHPLLGDPRMVDQPADLGDVSAYMVAGAMARHVDVAGALAAHPGPAAAGVSGRIGLDVADPVFGAASFDLELRDRLAPTKRRARDRLRLGIDRLAQVYFGAVSARVLLEQGLAEGSLKAATLLDAAFAGPPLHLMRRNYF